jgi:signal transduction histidine kinase
MAKTWIMLMFAAVIALTVGALVWFALVLRTEARDTFFDQQIALERSTAQGLQLAWRVNDRASARTLLAELRHRRVFVGALVLDAERRPALSLPETFTLTPTQIDGVVSTGSCEVSGIAYTATPLRSETGGLIGWFVLVQNPAEQDVDDNATLWRILSTAVPALIVLLGLCGWQVVRSQRAWARAAAAEETSNRAKGEFLANMSHEIRTPMTAVLGWSEVLEEDASDPNARADAIAAIRRNGTHLLELINDILDLSKIEAGRMDVERVEFDLVELVYDVLDMLRPRAVQKGIGFGANVLAPFPRRVLADPTRLRQILVNLIGNAIKFTERGSVTIEIDHRPGNERPLVLAVVDTGIGVPPDRLDSLFEPFRQADSSTTRKFGGTGLGLAISRRLAERMGGTLSVASVVGKGSCFTLHLPAVASGELVTTIGSPIVDPAPPPANPAPLLVGKRVLVAEDGLDNQLLIRRLLERWGAVVRIVGNGREAVDDALAAVTTDAPFDLVLMDMLMPTMDGYAATDELRCRGYAGPIVALTANAMQGDRDKCLAVGCTDYATKPFRRQELEKIFARLLPAP